MPAQEALLLRAYTSDLTVLTFGREMHIPREERAALEEAGICILDEPVAALAIAGDKIASWHMQEGGSHAFERSTPRSACVSDPDLATALGAEADEDGALIVDEHQRTTVPGLYAAGDVVRGLSQVAVAAGQAAVAATDIHNSLPPLISG